MAIELKATVREKGGKGNARKMRAQKLIPAVVYGPGEEPLNIALDPIELRKALQTPKKLNTILTLKLDKGGDRTVLVKDFQTDVVRHDVLLHADFYSVKMDSPVKVNIPLAFVGTPAGVADGGILQTLRRELELWILPESIPEKIDVDVSGLKIGQSLHVKDMTLPAGARPTTLVNYTIASLVAPEAESTRGGGEAAAGAVGAAAGGDKAGAAPAKKEEKKKELRPLAGPSKAGARPDGSRAGPSRAGTFVWPPLRAPAGTAA